MSKSNKEIAMEVLKRAFIDRDPTVVEQYFGANYKQHNPVIPDGPSAIAEMVLSYFSGLCIERNLKSGKSSSTRKIKSFMTALRGL